MEAGTIRDGAHVPELSLRERRQRMMNEDIVASTSSGFGGYSLDDEDEDGDETAHSARTDDYSYPQCSPSKKQKAVKRLPITPRSPSKIASIYSGKSLAKPAPISSSPSNSSSSSPRIALTFAGHVYRTIDSTVAGVSYSAEGDFFGHPDEQVGDAKRDRGDVKRVAMEREMLVKKNSSTGRSSVNTTPTKRHRPSFESHHQPQHFLVDPVSTLVPKCLFPSTKPTLTQDRKQRQSAATSAVIAPLPPSLKAVMSLYIAFDAAIIAFLGAEGSALASSSISAPHNGENVVWIPNLIEYTKLKPLLESNGQKFGENELKRLVWALEGRISEDDERVERESEDEDGLRIGLEGARGEKERGGLGYTFTSAEMIGPLGKIIHTHVIGIRMIIRINPQLPLISLIPPVSPNRSSVTPSAPHPPLSPLPSSRRVVVSTPKSPRSSSSLSGRESMSIVATWPHGSGSRKRALEGNLRAWGMSFHPKGSTTAFSSFPDPLPLIPLAILPVLVPLLPSAASPHAFSTRQKMTAGQELSSPTKSSEAGMLAGKKMKVGKLGKVKQREQALLDRIQAKQAANQPSEAYLANFNALNSGISPTKSLRQGSAAAKAYEAERSEMFRRRSLLSRMGAVADGVWALFTMSGSRRPILLEDVALSIAKSSPIALSFDESLDALALLCSTCPNFVHVKSVDHQDWMAFKCEIELREVKEIFAIKLKEAKEAKMI